MRTTALTSSQFGARVDAACEHELETLPALLNRHHGLLLLPGHHAISDDPGKLVALSRRFGDEVENYYQALLPRTMVHPEIAEILLVSNAPPCSRQPPPQPNPPRTADGGFPVSFPHRRGWHTDQSYRRPPPDISLFYCVTPAPPDQAQTLYADGTAAYAALPDRLKQRVDALVGLHVKPGTGRSEQAVRAGEPPQPLAAHEQPQRQPVVRRHPVTGEPALYLCEAGQMDWVDGPFVGMQPGPDGDGARLLYELMAIFTQPAHVYVHEWRAGDLIIYDNRCTVHAATWFDAERYQRVMWRTTVRGNPGNEYVGESRSWIPAA